MTVQVIYKKTCDRCKSEFKDSCDEKRIGKLTFKLFGRRTIRRMSFTIMRNGSGSQRSDMSLDLCPPCTKEFLSFMSGVSEKRPS